MSKIILHIVFGITVVSQAKVFSASTDKPPDDNAMAINTRVAIFGSTAIAAGLTLYFWTKRLLERTLPKVDA